jgi:hypothetical protein
VYSLATSTARGSGWRWDASARWRDGVG